MISKEGGFEVINHINEKEYISKGIIANQRL